MENKQTILKFGDIYQFGDMFQAVDKLPNETFLMKEDAFGRLFLKQVENQRLPEKIYSNDKDFIEHVTTAFNRIEGSMGVLLTGKKGLGKTFTARVLCDKLGIPVIKITTGTDNKGIFEFLNKIQQPHVIFIDEFEKMFRKSDGDKDSSAVNQQHFLSYLDGNNSSNAKKFFLITTNNYVNDYMVNRPSRLRYVRTYETISDDTVREIVNDLLKDEELRKDLLENLNHKELNIDILIKVIEEVNVTGKKYSEFKDFFNYQVESNNYSFYIVNKDGSLKFIGSKDSYDDWYEDDYLPVYINGEAINIDSIEEQTWDKAVVRCHYRVRGGEREDAVIIGKRNLKTLKSVF